MGFPTTEILGLIYQLLPGFIAAWIFYAFTAHPIKSPFERSVQALIFTGFVKAIVIALRFLLVSLGKCGCNFGPLTTDGEYLMSVLVGISVGFIFSIFANTNALHKRLPNWVTKKSSYASEWYSVFNETERWVYLHMKDERRLYAWAAQWPDSPTTGHFVLTHAEWILEDNVRVPLLLTERLLIPARDVVMVEFEKTFEELQQVDIQQQANAEKTLIDLRKSVEGKTITKVVETATQLSKAKSTRKPGAASKKKKPPPVSNSGS